MDRVALNWRGPYAFERAREVEPSENRGIYAITIKRGSTERIVRIGRTYDQAFYQRLSGYKLAVKSMSGSAMVRFGIFASEVSRISRQRLSDVECLLIYVHQPRLNDACRDKYSGRDLEIVNRGRRGPIKAIVRSSDL